VKPTTKSQRGFAIVSAVFLLVVLAALGGYAVTLSGSYHMSTMSTVLGSRATFAARSGLEWAASDIVNNGAANLDCGPGTTSFSLTGGGLDGFDVAVSCSSASVTEGADTYTVYQLTSTATRGSPADLDHAARTLIATVAF